MSSSAAESGAGGGEVRLVSGRRIDDDIVEAVLSDGELGPNSARCKLVVPSLARLESDELSGG